jgi:NADPH-dependent 2,4-dienoyl-CoA reductase/sulfur reductase-like enzyme
MSPEPRVRFTVDGRPVEAGARQSVAAALMAAGIETLSRSSKYRRPRGIYCAGGYCPNCLLRIDGKPHVRSCMTPARDGLVVELEGSTSARVDARRVIDRVGGLFPVGFQYRYFKRQNLLWRIWEGQLRKAAAETPVPDELDVPKAVRREADLLVVGGGPAGLGAAAAAEAAALSVVLVSRRTPLGGRLRPAIARGEAAAEIQDAISAVHDSERVDVIAPGTVAACFGNVFWIDVGTHLVELTANSSVLATGAYERPVIFAGNDRPGVMLTSAVRRLALEDRVLGGRRVALVTRDDSAYDAAVELGRAGTRVKAVIDERPIADDVVAELRATGVEVVAGARTVKAVGSRRVRGIVVETGATTRTIECDLVGMSGGWTPADELRYVATSTDGDVVHGERATALSLDSNIAQNGLAVLQGVGGVVGATRPDLAFAEGALAGALAGGRVASIAEAAARVRSLRAGGARG